MPITEPIVTAIIGLLGGVLGGVIAVKLQYWHSRRQTIEERRFSIYMMLLDLWSKHFWIVSAETRGEVAPQQARWDFSHFRYRISDELRKADSLSEADDILTAMFSLKFKTESERATALDRVIERLGGRVNPRVGRAMKRIGEENQRLMVDHEEWWRRRAKIESP